MDGVWEEKDFNQLKCLHCTVEAFQVKLILINSEVLRNSNNTVKIINCFLGSER